MFFARMSRCLPLCVRFTSHMWWIDYFKATDFKLHSEGARPAATPNWPGGPPCRRETGEGNMRFQVGKYTCELSANEGGTVLAAWLPEAPKYLNKDERAQWQAGLTTFLNSLIKDDPRPDRRNNGSAARVKNLLCLIMAAGLLARCARGGGSRF